jgi:GNAT superfamily N-acetyltransferase
LPLKGKLFTIGDLALADVQAFNCGDLKRDLDVARFLTCEARDLIDKPENPLHVWLYRDEDDSLVGFSSLGRSEWCYPKPTGIKTAIQIIPNLAVSVDHKGKKYSTEILEDTIVEAIARRESVSELLGLFVHIDNPIAIHIYESAKFANYGNPRTYGGDSYQRMILKLPSEGAVDIV